LAATYKHPQLRDLMRGPQRHVRRIKIVRGAAHY
jgi:hypothetical protein